MDRHLLILLFFFCIGSLCFAQPFATVQTIDPNTGNEPYEIASGDLDGDGDIDIVMATYDYNDNVPNQDYIKWYKNDGMGNFTIETTVSSTIQWVDGLTVANIDGQFGLDIVATSVNQDKLVYFLSDGTGGFGAEVVVDGTLAAPGQVVAGDINNDGNIDLATMSYTDNKTVWYAGDGAGNFTPGVDIENGTTDGPYNIDLADFDGDGDLDAVVAFVNTQTIEIFYNQYVESGTMTVSWIKDAVSVDAGSTYIQNILVGDVNNDGTVNVVKVDNVSGIVSWYNKTKNGPSVENVIQNNTIITRPGTAFVVDLDNDTLNDVIVTDGGSNDDAIIYFKGAANASPSATEVFIANNNHQMWDIVVEDFDGDMDKDIAAVGNFSDTIDYIENQLIVLSVSEASINDISIYPNPTDHFLNFKNIQKVHSASVYDSLGKKVMNVSIGFDTSLDVSGLDSGMYILKIEDVDSTFKFIKQ
ncbi:MAG: T9SS type A sorting domain-containing protein [Gelidibacter sp.]